MVVTDGGFSGARGVLVVLGALVVIAAGLGAWGALADPQDGPTDRFTFEEVAENDGLEYRYDGRQVVNGNPGVYVTDFDNDDWEDLLLIGNESRGPTLFENTGMGYEPAGVLPDSAGDQRIHSALFFDYDNDGWEDLLLLPDPQRPIGGYTEAAGPGGFSTNTSSPLLFENDEGTFEEPRALESVDLQPYPIGATAADYDGDGCLDVFVYQNGNWADRTPVGYRNPTTVENITDDNGEPNLLLRGDCEGGFSDVSEEAGVAGDRWSLAASFVDLTGDGHPDVHVANDFNRDVVYVNQGDGTFAERSIPGTDRNGMSSEVADVDGDGRPDVFVTNIGMAAREGADVDRDTGGAFDRQAAAESPRYQMGNQLLENRGNGTFVDVAGDYGVQNTPYVWGWAAAVADLDNDGDLDVVHANNEKSTITNEGGRVMMRWTDTPPAVWDNVGTHTDPEFAYVRAQDVGLQPMNARGLVRLDYDRDGDLDLVAADAGDDVKLYENRVETGSWLQVELGESRSAGAVGGTIAVTAGNETHHRFGNVGADFLSQRGRVAHVGLDGERSVDRLTVTWPDGSRTTVRDIAVNQRVRVYPNGTAQRVRVGMTWMELDEEDMP